MADTRRKPLEPVAQGVGSVCSRDDFWVKAGWNRAGGQPIKKAAHRLRGSLFSNAESDTFYRLKG